jgi:hypothetical protein
MMWFIRENLVGLLVCDVLACGSIAVLLIVIFRSS